MKRTRRIQKIAAYAMLGASCLVAIFPVLWIALSSVKHEVDAQAPATEAFNFTPTLDNYQLVLGSQLFWKALVTTLVVTVVSTLLCTFAGTLAAYGFARYTVRGRRLLVTLLVLVQVVPSIVLLIPLYRIASILGLYDRWIVVIVVQGALATPFVTWTMLAFIRTIPIELEEAAFVDGASRPQLFRHILVPLLAPGLVASAIFTGVAAWNSFLIPVILGQSRTLTLTTYVAGFITQEQLQWAQMCAASVCVFLPITIFALLLQRPLVAGITAGSLKG